MTIIQAVMKRPAQKKERGIRQYWKAGALD
jgi:hypothetical protein